MAWSRSDITETNEGVDRGEKNDYLDMREQREGYDLGFRTEGIKSDR
jgi:hypothetical protein